MMAAYKIVIAPTKTMRHTDVLPLHNTHLFESNHKQLLNRLQSLSFETLKDVLKASDKLVKKAQHDLRQDTVNEAALFAYSGAQFNALDVESLSPSEREYLEANVRILSGLYGVLRPFDGVMHYRLPMASTVEGVALSAYWRNIVKPYFNNQTIINLASKEYANILPSENIIDVRFMTKQGKTLKTTPGVHAKPTRGAYLREAARTAAFSDDDFQAIVAHDHSYSALHSNARQWTYIKNDPKAV